MIIKTQPVEKDVVQQFDDLRVVKKLESKRYGGYYYVHNISRLPDFFNKIYRYAEYEMNLYHLTCSCSFYADKSLLFAPRDVRRICKHLYYKLQKSNTVKFIDQLTWQFLHAAVKFNSRHFYKFHYPKHDKTAYFLFAEHTDWINVLVQVRPEDDADYVNFGFNPYLHRWSYGAHPPFQLDLEYIIEKIIKNQLPYEHKKIERE